MKTKSILVAFSILLLPLSTYAQLLDVHAESVSHEQTSSTAEESPINQYFELPKGIEFVGPKFTRDPRDEDALFVTCELTIAKDADVDKFIEQLKTKGMLATKDIADMVSNVNSWFKGQPIELKTKMHLAKGRPPYLAYSHLVVGDVKPSFAKRHHTIEISEKVLQQVSRKALTKFGVIQNVHKFDYSFTIPNPRRTAEDLAMFSPVGFAARQFGFYKPAPATITFKRIGWVQMSDLYPVCRPGSLEIHCDNTKAFAPVATANRGVSLSSSKVKGAVEFKRVLGKQNVIELSASLDGSHKMGAGMGILDPLVQTGIAKLSQYFFPSLANMLGKTYENSLIDVLPIVKGSTNFKNVNIGRKNLNFDLAPIHVDLGQTVEVLLGQKTPVNLDDIDVRHDRVSIGLTNNFVAVTD